MDIDYEYVRNYDLMHGLGMWFRQGTAQSFEPYILEIVKHAPRLKRVGFTARGSRDSTVRAFWDVIRERDENEEVHTTLVNIDWKEGDAEWTRAVEGFVPESV